MKFILKVILIARKIQTVGVICQQDPNLHMASSDVQPLFTNIPLDDTVKFCGDLDFYKKGKFYAKTTP